MKVLCVPPQSLLLHLTALKVPNPTEQPFNSIAGLLLNRDTEIQRVESEAVEEDAQKGALINFSDSSA